MLFHCAADLPDERVGQPAGAVDRRLDPVRELLPAGPVGAARLRRRGGRGGGLLRVAAARRRAARTAPGAGKTRGALSRGAMVARLRRRRAGGPTRSRTSPAGTSTASMPARSRASTSSRLPTSTCAIASLPAGTSGSSSSTASSGSTSSSMSRAVSRKISGSSCSSASSSSSSSRTSTTGSRCAWCVVVVGPDRDRVGLGRRAAADPEQRQARRLADPLDRRGDRERLRALFLGVSRGAGVVDADDDRDAISLGDVVAETARTGHCFGRSVTG